MATQKKKTSAKKPVAKKVAVKKQTVKKVAPKKSAPKKTTVVKKTTGKPRGPYKKSEAQRLKEESRRLEKELNKVKKAPEPKIEESAKYWADEDFDYLDHPRKEESGLLGLAIIGAIIIVLVGIIWLLAK